MRFALLALIITLLPTVGHSSLTKKEAYAISMENDARFIESVGSLFNALANLQRTLPEQLEWKSNNSEYAKIQKAIGSFETSRKHLTYAVSNSDRLLNEISDAQKKTFEPQLESFKKKISDLDNRLKFIVLKLKSNQFPERAYLHETIELALAGVGFGMSVAKSKEDPAKSQ